MSVGGSLMMAEAGEAAAVVARQRARNADLMERLGERLRALCPRAVATLARGSSDNAATYGRHLVEVEAGTLAASLAPSVASIYDAAPDMAGTVLVALSQSGRSPDLVAAAAAARARGALVVALVNDEGSPLFAQADAGVPLDAGPERSVAATKSFIATLAAELHLVAAWTGAAHLWAALDALPDALADALRLDWSAAVAPLADAAGLFTVGRGVGLGLAQEAALKLKEVGGLHAEAFSAAEVRHGPMALVGPGFPVLLFGQADGTRDGVAALAAEFAGRGGPVMGAGLPTGTPGVALPAPAVDPVIQPIALAAAFYRLAAGVAAARGRDPDRPPHLRKVTETV